ncbi:MAG: alpha/beta hydrolase [Labilithrix sp.]|nr:alpha/beta hydrolase [Labilithrix sp.]MCW5817174.1 alpha/beta hydrolase [Labilithrix sp.]
MAKEHVLFIHSTGVGPFLWSGVPVAAVGGRNMLLPANLGYAPNPTVERGVTVTVEDETRHLLARIPDDGAKVHVVAHSYGGLVGLYVLEALGSRAASAFLFEPVLFGALANDEASDPEAVAQAKAFASHPTFVLDLESGGREPWLETFVDYWNRPGSWKKLPPMMRELSLAAGWKMFQEVRACFSDDRPFADWKLEVPATIVRGERSTVAARAMALALARGRPNATLVDLPGAPHMAPLTKPELVISEVSSHFARLS